MKVNSNLSHPYLDPTLPTAYTMTFHLHLVSTASIEAYKGRVHLCPSALFSLEFGGATRLTVSARV